MMENIIVKSSSYFKFIKCEGADTVTVVFSARNDRPPKFTFWKTVSTLNSHIIFLNSDVPEWYRNGIPGISGGIRGAVKEILAFRDAVKAKRLVMTGSSMGAYGALLYGSIAKADQILVFGVEPLLGVPGGKTEITRNNLQYMYPDLTILSLPPTTIYYGGMDINDILGAWLLHKRRKVDVVCIPESQHDTPDFLVRKNLLVEVFEDLVSGSEVRKFGYGLGDVSNDEVITLLWKLNGFLVEKNWIKIQSEINSVPHIVEASPFVAYLYGISNFRRGDFKVAYKNISNLIDKVPAYWEAWMNLSAINLKLGNLEEAINSARFAIKLRPHRSIAHVQLSYSYSCAGNNEMAFEHAEWACKLNYSRPEYFERLEKIALVLNRSMPNKDALKNEYDVNVKAAQEKFSDYNFFDKK